MSDQGQSALGLAGLIFSALGWVTCGLLCIPGALLSFMGLFSQKPKGLAIAGLIVGFPGVVFFVFVGAGLILSMLGLGAAATVVANADLNDLPTVSEALPSPENELIDLGNEAQLPSDAEEEMPNEPAEMPEEPAGMPEEPAGMPEESEEMTGEPDEPVVEPELPQPPANAEEAVAFAQEQLAMWKDANPPLDFPVGEPRVFVDAKGANSVKATVIALTKSTVVLTKEDGSEVTVPLSRLSDDDRSHLAETYSEYFSKKAAWEEQYKALKDAVREAQNALYESLDQ